MRIHLKDIDAGNWREALRLEPNAGREHFVAASVRPLAEVYVKPEWEGENERCEEVTLTAEPSNLRAQSLYGSLGFEDTGRVHSGEQVFTLRPECAGEGVA
jgi:hypothetical protein